MLKTLFVIIFMLAVFAVPCSAEDVPFKLEKGLIVISAKIIKGDPIEAVISTGTPESILSDEYISKHKVKLGYTNDGPVTGSNDKLMFFAQVPNVLVGDQKPASLTAKRRSLDSMSKAVGREIAMILGIDYFKGKIVQIDFEKGVIRFLDRSPFDYKTARSVNGPDPVSLFLKMDKLGSNFFGIGMTLPVVDEILYDGTKIRTLVETAETAAPVAISPSGVKRLGLPVPDKGTSKAAQLKTISLNGYPIEQVPVLLFGKNAGLDQDANDYGAVLGIKVLKNFRVTFDWNEKMIVLER